MTGLLTGTNKFKNVEIETSQKISVLNAPYLEGRKYVYGGGDSITLSSDLNYKIYDAGVRPNESDEIEDGFYAITKTGKEKSVAVVYQITKTSNGYNVRPCSHDGDSNAFILLDYNNPNTMIIFNEDTEIPSYVEPSDTQFSQQDIVKSIDHICSRFIGTSKLTTGSMVYLKEFPILKGCIKVRTDLENHNPGVPI